MYTDGSKVPKMLLNLKYTCRSNYACDKTSLIHSLPRPVTYTCRYARKHGCMNTTRTLPNNI